MILTSFIPFLILFLYVVLNFPSFEELFILFYFIITFFVFCLSKAAPVAYGCSQARGLIGALAPSLCQSHDSRSEPTPQVMAMPDP